MILYVIQIEPLLLHLQRNLVGLQVGPARKKALGYIDNMATLGDKEEIW
jgi:hypothetical protein